MRTLTCLSLTFISMDAYAHLAIDHLKQGLESRYSKISEDDQIAPKDKQAALDQLRKMQDKYAQTLSLSLIPSQEDFAEESLKELHTEIQEFDQTVNELEQK